MLRDRAQPPNGMTADNLLDGRTRSGLPAAIRTLFGSISKAQEQKVIIVSGGVRRI
ncbi:hypothetical protein [Mesorhizobium sp.]|uniref:hypothetical protein n=1 Tax=Mesorhizobium sp. TaxID=1871066 RepID=UPI0025E99B6A|nr:hypothetical protein [Mesorhizobium sp.]